MKTEKDKLIDFVIWLKEQDPIIKNALDPSNTVLMYLQSINPRNETDGHRRLEDNKAKEEFCHQCKGSDVYKNKQYRMCGNCQFIWIAK